jgi:exonuclease SbcD
MRILHTSDWHLGRSVGPVSLSGDQEAFVDWLVGVVAAESVDLVVIAGDIYDRSIPPTESVVLFREALQRLRATGARVAAITGNHDGADRVDTYHDLLDGSGVLLRGGYSAVGEVLTLDFADGPLDLVLLPFLDPQAAPDRLPTDAPDPSDDSFARRIKRTHQSVLAAAVEAVQPSLGAPRSLAVSHAFVAGAVESESERQLTIGGTAAVDAAVFEPFSYTALGHLHRPQDVAGKSTLRYSGTPLAYSFSEEHAKSVTVVDMAPDGACTIEHVAVPVGRAVLTIEGTLDTLLQARPTAAAAQSLVRAIITDPGVVLDAKQKLSAVYPHVVEIVLKPTNADGTPVVDTGAVVDRRTQTPADIAEAFWQASVGAQPAANERTLLHLAIEHAEGKVA